MIALKTPSPIPCADAEDRANEDWANEVSPPGASGGAKPPAPPDFAVIYVANRYRLPMHVAALVARLANVGRAL
jgi:hypothetical protein